MEKQNNSKGAERRCYPVSEMRNFLRLEEEEEDENYDDNEDDDGDNSEDDEGASNV